MGLFGGTFDPPHVGHVAVAADVADALGLDQVLWIPAGEPPHKRDHGVTAAEVRLAMVREAAATDPRFEVATIELERAGPSYTVDSVRALRRERPDDELFLILGADQLSSLDTWREPQEIVRHVRLVLMDREGASAATAARAQPAAAAAEVVPVRRVDVSSTDVRARVSEGRDITGLVVPGVQEIIERQRLYSAP